MLPQVPDARPDDPEDVSWALSTAEAMWARGDHAEGIKWVRRAAEAASEADRDARALDLAKAAADLAGAIARRTRASIDLEELEPIPEPAPPPVPPASSSVRPKPASDLRAEVRVTDVRVEVRATAAPVASATALKPAMTPSRPPAPLPSRTSQPPPSIGRMAHAAKAPAAVRASQPPPSPARAAALASRPLVGKPLAATKPDKDKDNRAAKRSARRSRDNLDAEARKALGAVAARAAPAMTDAAATGVMAKTAPAMTDAAATGRATKAAPVSASVGGRASAAPPHEPGLTTTQAVRVVVWRDASGVHLAPAGAVVSATSTVDAVLVALEPKADLTAWLTEERR